MQKDNLKNDTPTDANNVLAAVHLDPYCTDCGGEDLAYIDQYANGEYWKCKDCGKQFIHKLHKDE